jgi:hypothetical protein
MRMYRRLIVSIATAAAVLAATPAFGQTFKLDSKAFGPSSQQNTTPPPPAQQRQQPSSGLGIGALGGITWTTANTENDIIDTTFDSGTGWMAGLWFGGNRDGRVGLMGEFSYVVKKNTVTEFGDELKQTLNYIEIPVLLRINTGSLNREKPSLYFLVGPVFDIQIKSVLEFEDEEIDTPDDLYEGLDIGLMAGVGFEVVRIGIEARYTWGLKSVLGTDEALENDFGKTKLNTFQVVFKIRFN